MRQYPREVENYTKPFLVMACLLLFMGLVVLWAAFNFAVSLVSGVMVHQAINRLPAKD